MTTEPVPRPRSPRRLIVALSAAAAGALAVLPAATLASVRAGAQARAGIDSAIKAYVAHSGDPSAKPCRSVSLGATKISTVDPRYAEAQAQACGYPKGVLLKRNSPTATSWTVVDLTGVNGQPCSLIEKIVPKPVLQDLHTIGTSHLLNSSGAGHKVVCVAKS